MDFRKTFDQIPEEFDKYRPRYREEVFLELMSLCKLDSDKKVLEIGPGTGQATEPILKTGCDYTAIELGENFVSFLNNKFSAYPNFHVVNADFETWEFEENTYDLVYSAATIQWIPEETAFTKTFRMLKPGGYLAMFMACSNETSRNTELRAEIDKVYEKHFRVKQGYSCKMDYRNALHYGFTNWISREWKSERTVDADAYISWIGTHCEHIMLEEPYKTRFYEGIREAFHKFGNRMVIIDTIPLYLVQKPVR